MLDIKLIRENPEKVKSSLKKVGDEGSIDKLLSLDEKRRNLLKEVETLRNTRNTVSKEIGTIKDPDERGKKIAGMKTVNDSIKKIENDLEIIENDFKTLMLNIPNIPLPSVPEGKDDSENITMEEKGSKPEFSFAPLPHWEIGEKSGGIDFERGVKISGTRFYILRGEMARLQRALITFMLDVHIKEHGFDEVYTPFMVKEHCMYGTGQLPKFGDNLYRDAEEDFYMIPTAEVPVTNMYAKEILDIDTLPIKHVSYTACFRREKMSAGKETRGIKRGHQFDKVEMVCFVKPEESEAMFEKMVGWAENILEKLELPYRKIQMCAGDLSFTAAAKYDLEVWAAGCSEWLEVSSISNFSDFQARRASIKFKRSKNDKPEFVHTLNGSGVALPRTMIAIIENNQTEDGKIRIPEVLVPYMGGQTVIG